jgi:hypothetical protein
MPTDHVKHPVQDDEIIEDERAYFLTAWEQTVEEVREEVEKERSAEADPPSREHRHGRRKLVSQ